MPCYHPLDAYRAPGGAITFKEYPDGGPPLQLPCGRCIGCRIKQTQEWTIRCIHESQMHRENAYITLTYADDHIDPNLQYGHFQKFIRRLRKARPQQNIRYFVAGEYGGKTARPHWHALIFGTTFRDQQPVGENLYRAPELEKLWNYGFSSIGEVNWQTAGYVAAYCTKKIEGRKVWEILDPDTGELTERTPEFAKMSLNPAIGKTWLEKYWREVYLARDGIIKPGGAKLKAPRYYDKLIAGDPRKDAFGNVWTKPHDKKRLIEIETERQQEAIKRQKDNTAERLKVKEQVTKARLKQRERGL